MIASSLVALALAAAAQAHAPNTATLSVPDLFKPAQYEQVEVSPDGTKLAIAYHVDDGTRVTVLDRASMKPVAQVSPGSRGQVGEMAWLGNQHLLISANHRLAGYDVAIVNPQLYLVDLQQKHPKLLSDDFIGTIDGDTTHILVRSCEGFDHGNCVRRINPMDADEKGELLAKAPKETDLFTVDHTGRVRFAIGWDKTARSRLYVRERKDKWTLVNDSDKSHVDVIPLGVSRDDRSAFVDAEQPSGTDVIERYDFATGERSPLLRDPDSDPLRMIYSLDRREIIGAWYGPGRPHARFFYPSSADAKWYRALNKSFPQSTVMIESASSDGQTLVVRTQSDTDPGSFYLLDRPTHKLQLLFPTRPWLKPDEMAPVRAFSMHARDGLALHGFVALPTSGTKPAPMVVIVHGGPYGISDDWSFDPETQLLASHGYAVLHVNFRGSGGFGLDFVQRGYLQWGRAMQDDVTDATHWAVQQGLADPGHICIYGASYGGYSALMGAAREPGLYRCAIGLAGVYDLNRLYSWGDIHRSDYGMHYLNRVLGKDPKELAANSPDALASRITIPVLLAHGNLDGRVPVKYARAMRQSMQSAGKPVEYITYAWEGHGLSRPDDILDFYKRMLQFLHIHLATCCVTSSSVATTKPRSAGSHALQQKGLQPIGPDPQTPE